MLVLCDIFGPRMHQLARFTLVTNCGINEQTNQQPTMHIYIAVGPLTDYISH